MIEPKFINKIETTYQSEMEILGYLWQLFKNTQ